MFFPSANLPIPVLSILITVYHIQDFKSILNRKISITFYILNKNVTYTKYICNILSYLMMLFPLFTKNSTNGNADIVRIKPNTINTA